MISGSGSLQADPESSGSGPRQAEACPPAPIVNLPSLLVRICDENIIALFNSLVKSHNKHSGTLAKVANSPGIGRFSVGEDAFGLKAALLRHRLLPNLRKGSPRGVKLLIELAPLRNSVN